MQVSPGTDLQRRCADSGWEDPNAIGYVSLPSVKDNVKAISVNGVAPSEATIKDGSYAVQCPFVLVTKEGVELSETAQAFFNYITSAEARDIISAAGVVPANEIAMRR